ncbi:glutaconate CoA-transferase subunit B [Stella humosa]|uniref:Glutaconate CoA-transferase subunit B n=1 Tax=Stella humosa TaxID=94 RepID=A0A3N1MD46_9PROT|nr:CoA-transferase [Stella humosa]ROQ01518.1 glutaconate CoA-transferase subunit B [Stella humosa]BBK31897.1 CoA synthetase [Stella humosa]
MSADAPAWRREELLIAVLARLLDGVEHVAVGASSPIPGAAALLQRALSKGAMRVSVLGSRRHNPFTEGGRELFDCAAQGRIGAFFLGGGEIDGEANINLVGMGDYPRLDVRFPGSFGSAYLYMLVPRVILFREEHSRRVFVPKVNFVSAPGTSDPGVYRPGGPHALVTGMACFDFDRTRRRFSLASVHPGHDAAGVAAETGFDYDVPSAVPETAPPPPEWLELLRGRIAGELAETYPKFASTVFGASAAA